MPVPCLQGLRGCSPALPASRRLVGLVEGAELCPQRGRGTPLLSLLLSGSFSMQKGESKDERELGLCGGMAFSWESLEL